MYLDLKGLVTTGCGNLLEPSGIALGLPWRHLDGRPATPLQIADAWVTVKARHDLQDRGGMAFRHVTDLRLSEEAIDDLVRRKLGEVNAQLRDLFPRYELVCSDAQLGAISMCWAMGAGGVRSFTRFCQAFREERWAEAADECHMRDADNPGLRPRNAANRALFANAAQVAALELDPDALYWPRDLSAECPPAA